MAGTGARPIARMRQHSARRQSVILFQPPGIRARAAFATTAGLRSSRCDHYCRNQAQHHLRRHHRDSQRPASRRQCPPAAPQYMLPVGLRTEQQLGAGAGALPAGAKPRIDRDTTSVVKARWSSIREFTGGSACILIGTQMRKAITGRHAGGVADVVMALFRRFSFGGNAAQLYTQFGRAGRAGKQGEVVLQTQSSIPCCKRYRMLLLFASRRRRNANA